MPLYSKYNFTLILALIIVLFPSLSFSQAPDTTVYDEICDIRQMFCDEAALAVAAGAVLVIGFLLFIGKAEMTVILVTAAGLVIFISADILVEALMDPPVGAPVMNSCSCD